MIFLIQFIDCNQSGLLIGRHAGFMASQFMGWSQALWRVRRNTQRGGSAREMTAHWLEPSDSHFCESDTERKKLLLSSGVTHHALRILHIQPLWLDAERKVINTQTARVSRWENFFPPGVLSALWPLCVSQNLKIIPHSGPAGRVLECFNSKT